MTNIAAALSSSALIIALAGASLPAAAAPGMKAACTVRNAPAGVLQPAIATRSQLAEMQDLSGTALIKIDLDSDGIAHNPTVLQSSGYAVLDDSALASLNDQRFSPEIRDCAPVPGTYTVGVDFVK